MLLGLLFTVPYHCILGCCGCEVRKQSHTLDKIVFCKCRNCMLNQVHSVLFVNSEYESQKVAVVHVES